MTVNAICCERSNFLQDAVEDWWRLDIADDSFTPEAMQGLLLTRRGANPQCCLMAQSSSRMWSLSVYRALGMGWTDQIAIIGFIVDALYGI